MNRRSNRHIVPLYGKSVSLFTRVFRFEERSPPFEVPWKPAKNVFQAAPREGQQHQQHAVLQGLTLVPISAQLERFCPPYSPEVAHECVLELLKLSSAVNECKPLPSSPFWLHTCMGDATTRRNSGVMHIGPHAQGLTLVHFSGQRKHILWDSCGAWVSPSLLDRGT